MKRWQNKVWKAKELAWLKQNEGTYTTEEVAERFNCERSNVYYILAKHKLEFINKSAQNGFKKGNRYGKNITVTPK